MYTPYYKGIYIDVPFVFMGNFILPHIMQNDYHESIRFMCLCRNYLQRLEFTVYHVHGLVLLLLLFILCNLCVYLYTYIIMLSASYLIPGRLYPYNLVASTLNNQSNLHKDYTQDRFIYHCKKCCPKVSELLNK